MSELSHYEKLGVDENSSFEEIQQARTRLLEECNGDRRQMESVEASYDAILMDRLRLRQEGRIKVPDRIRFPERVVEPAPDFPPAQVNKGKELLRGLVDTPSRADILLPAGLMSAAALLSLSAPPLALALGVGFCFYFLNRKEQKFIRSFLLTLIALIVGVVIGSWASTVLLASIQFIGLSAENIASLFTLGILWLVSSFLR
ncbi:MAG: CPP1-like family protein [Kaiparowitsia implicata GSE-PSE-MK54-09C]|jgi:hypothetical protein|nr:CPP1-like family protein [Kaiparowitsia implicata GSE-PSE-MK54-09C]